MRCSERRAHSNITITLQTYLHVVPILHDNTAVTVVVLFTNGPVPTVQRWSCPSLSACKANAEADALPRGANASLVGIRSLSRRDRIGVGRSFGSLRR